MLDLTHYLEGFHSQLRKDPAFRQCFEDYLDGARGVSEGDVQKTIIGFLDAQAVQGTLSGSLHAEYAQAFRALSHLCMRLALLAESQADRQQERRRMSAELLMAICRAKDWVTQGKQEDRFRADLWTGTLLCDVPVIYALVHESLTDEERAEVRRAVVQKGIRAVDEEWLDPMKHWHALDSMGHNWFLVIVCGAGIAALAFQDEEPQACLTVLQRVIDAIPRWFRYPGNALQYKKANFGPAGDYIEYLGYMVYGFASYFMLEFFYRDKTGSDALFEEAFLRPQPAMLIDFCRDTKTGPRMANFGDASEIWSKHQHVYYCIAVRLNCGALLAQQRQMTAGPNSWEDFLFYPLADSLQDDGPPTPERLSVYPHVGVAQARTGPGGQERFFAMRAGESWNHNHLDAGSFILTDHGFNIAIDSGTCDYGHAQYLAYYTATIAHNTLLLDGNGQDPDMMHSGTHQDGCFTAWLNAEKEGFQYLQADLTGPYAGVFTRFFRHTLLLRDWTVIVDDIQAFHPGEITWQMHFEGTPTLRGDYCVLADDSLSVAIFPLYPKSQALECEAALSSADRLSLKGPRHPLPIGDQLPMGRCLRICSQMDGRRAKVAVAVSRARQDADFPRPECTAFEGGEEIVFHGEDGRERLLINHHADGSVMHRNAWLLRGDIYTDAFLVYIREDDQGGIKTVSMVNGSSLTIGKAFSLGALVKLDACFDVKRRQVISHAVMATEMTICVEKEDFVVCLPEGHGNVAWGEIVCQ